MRISTSGSIKDSITFTAWAEFLASDAQVEFNANDFSPLAHATFTDFWWIEENIEDDIILKYVIGMLKHSYGATMSMNNLISLLKTFKNKSMLDDDMLANLIRRYYLKDNGRTMNGWASLILHQSEYDLLAEDTACSHALLDCIREYCAEGYQLHCMTCPDKLFQILESLQLPQLNIFCGELVGDDEAKWVNRINAMGLKIPESSRQFYSMWVRNGKRITEYGPNITRLLSYGKHTKSLAEVVSHIDPNKLSENERKRYITLVAPMIL